MMAYLYYRVLKFYSKTQEKDPLMMASGISSALLSCNLLALIFLFLAYVNPSVHLNMWLVLLGMTIVHACCHQFLVKRNDQYETRWSAESLTQKRLKGWLIIFYIAVTGAVLVYSYYLLHEARKNG